MLLRKAFKFRLEPTSQQRVKMAQAAGCVRLIWNRSLADVKSSLDKGEGYKGYNAMAGKLPGLKKQEDTAFLKLVHSQPLQQTLMDLDQALRDGFDKKKGFPTFKKKSEHKSFRYPQGVKINGRKLFLPKIGWVKYRKSRDVVGEIKNTTVKFDCGHWYASLQTEFEQEIAVHPGHGKVIGLDMGIANFVTSSDGERIAPLNSFKNHLQRLAKEQRKLARKKKGSQNRLKQIYRVQRLHKKIRDCRLDFLHKTANHFSKNHAVIVLEDLQVKNMSASSKGTVEEPGRNVRQKAGLNRAILDQGWGMFREFLTYKQEFLGGQVVLVPPQFTSQGCSQCGHVSKDNRPSQSVFCCTECNYGNHADINAALNIRAAGSAVLACGDISLVRAKAQESPSSEARVSG